jgi:hypothetical protein
MALTSIEPVNSMGFPFPLALGPLGQTTVSTTEIANELKSRGYIRGYAPTVVPTVAPTTVPTISRTDAIRAAVTKALSTYGYSSKCGTAGGCYIAPSRFDTIVSYAKSLADYYLARGSISGLTGLGQAQQPPTGMTTGELIAWGIRALSTLAGQGADFYLAYQQRKQWEAMGYQIPQYTSSQVEAIIKQYMAQNPGANEAQARQIAQGALVGESKTPEWLWPLVIGGVVLVAVMATRK